MQRNICYLFLLMALMGITGCETVKGSACGAASGFNQDVQNTSNSAQDGWHAITRADDWIRRNLW